MFAQINHVALISHQYNTLGKFYEAVFGLKSSAKGRPASAITIGDGYVGLNLIPRRDGYVEGIDHFGMVVDDVEPVLERMKRKHKNAAIVKRPSARPFAAYSGHDPDGNVFDLAQKKEVTRPGPDHIGFHVENLNAFKARVAEVAGMNPYLAGLPLGGSPESDVRKRFFAGQAGGKWQMSDPDGNWIDITDE